LGSAAPVVVEAELYNAATGTWTPASNLNEARAFHTMTLLANGKVLVAGGSGIKGRLTSAEVYTP
jgi:hypothetical protein